MTRARSYPDDDTGRVAVTANVEGAAKRDSMRWWLRIVAFFVLTAVVGWVSRRTGVPPIGVTVVAAVVWTILRYVVARYDDVAPPVEPRRPVAGMPHVRPEPSRTVPLLADSCAICGRTLTNPDSRRAGVGTECIKTHGPRPRSTPNPDHDRWNEEMVAARADQVEHQVALDQDHRAAIVVHRDRVSAWEVAVSTPDGAARRRARRRIKTLRTLVGITAWVALAGHFAQ